MLKRNGIIDAVAHKTDRLTGIFQDASPHPVCISGGITTMDELAFLDDAGAASVVLGMAIYTDTLNTHDVARRWGATTRSS